MATASSATTITARTRHTVQTSAAFLFLYNGFPQCIGSVGLLRMGKLTVDGAVGKLVCGVEQPGSSLGS